MLTFELYTRSMTLTNKVEQLFTNRPNSYVPAHTIGYHLGYSPSQYTHSDTLNWMHHYGVGMLTAPVRALMSYYGIIGPIASFFFTGIRLTVDQVMENSAGVGDLPWKWPINEQVIDLVHKGVYAVVVGYMTDRLVRGVTWFN